MTTGTPPMRSTSNMWYLPCGLSVGHVRHPGRHLVEVVQLQVDPGLVGDGQQVQDGVGRTAQRHDHGDGVLERLLGHDVPGPDPLFRAAG